MKLVTKYWCLETDDNIDSCRQRFPLLRYQCYHRLGHRVHIGGCYSSLGDEFCDASQHTPMRAFTALSQGRSAGARLVAQPFIPLLFRSGPQPWPDVLLNVLL